MQFIRQLFMFLITALVSFAFIGMMVTARQVERILSREQGAIAAVAAFVT